jgi:hypothetical protein
MPLALASPKDVGGGLTNQCALAFVANNASNDLLTCTSRSGVNWSESHLVNQQSKATPALASFGNTLVMAFVANNDKNDLLVCTSGDGVNWSDNHLVNQQSKVAPALAALGNTLVMAFVANSDKNDLLVCASADGVNWSDNHLVKQQSKMAPALAFDNFSQLVMAFVANNDSNELLTCVSVDGVNWSENVRMAQQSKTAPALAGLGETTVMAFVANNEKNDLLTSVINPSEVVRVADAPNHLVNQQSRTAPALTILGDTLVMAFVSNNDQNDLLVCTSRTGVNWSEHHVVNQQSKSGPALCVDVGDMMLGFVANNDTGDLLVCNSVNGVEWAEHFLVNQQSKTTPTVERSPVVLSADRVLAFVANNDSNDLLVVTSTLGDHWSEHHPVNQQSRTAPALACLGTVIGEDRKLLVMAFVANNQSNDLLTCTSQDAVHWSEHHLINQQSKTAPAMAAFGDYDGPGDGWRPRTLVLAFVANNESNDLLTCTSEDGVNWSEHHLVNQQTKVAPTLTVVGDMVLGNTLVLAFVANNETNDVLVCTSKDGLTWSEHHLVNQRAAVRPA